MIPAEELVGKVIDRREVSYKVEDAILYALAIGVGAEATDAKQLPYVYEEDLKTLPGFSLVVAYPGFWLSKPEYKVDWAKVLHAEESLTIHQPLPPCGDVVGETVVEEIIDRGPDKGAFIYTRKDLRDQKDGTLYASVTSNTLARADGGCGGSQTRRPRLPNVPERDADAIVELPTHLNSALLYRLCGDMNPLHADPKIAEVAGFERPILHGRCTLGVAHHAVLRGCCDYDASRFKSMDARFTAPFLPGETLRTELWHEDGEVRFRSTCVDRDIVVLDNGRVTLN